jgi:predicted metal-dependent phosphoesterase TrpH
LKTELSYYEVCPKVLPANNRGTITIRPLGHHAAFALETRYTITVIPMNETNRNDKAHAYPAYEAGSTDGSLSFSHQFGGEGQYCLRIVPQVEKMPRGFPLELRVYAVEEDLYRLRPYRGDLHAHTCYSDGREAPAIVAANYRKAGFDFLAITDHERYEPSIEAINAYRDTPLDIRLFPGEEVHPQENSTHYIHFGGTSSVNKLMRSDWARYHREVAEIAAGLDIPESLNRKEFASCQWVCREIHKAGGLAVMVHPHWIDDRAYHVREDMAAYMLKAKCFDAFELIGGQTLQENLPQVALWQQLRAEGNVMPVLGNSDSHGTVNGAWFNLAMSIVFAESPELPAIMDAIRQNRSVALEQYKFEPYGREPLPRMYGEYRYVMFALFLEEEYFPIHDELCFEEGRLMKDYVCGNPKAAGLLTALHGRCEALMQRYWGN